MMDTRKVVADAVIGGLDRLGFVLSRKRLDFDSRLESGAHLQCLFERIGTAMGTWLRSQRLFPVRQEFEPVEEASRFYADYLRMPFRDPQGGSRFNNALWLNMIAKAFQPSVIVDSGTYTGASAWTLSRGAPNARIYSFDIDLSNLRWRAPNVQYIDADWATFDFGPGVDRSTLCYFDDHIDQVRRLIEAAERGFELAIFDDDFPLTSFAAMVQDAGALPKIEFVLDDTLRDGEEIVWMGRRGRQTWRVDRARLDKARALIRETDRLPNTSLVTGIHQTPYRIVALERSPGEPRP